MLKKLFITTFFLAASFIGQNNAYADNHLRIKWPEDVAPKDVYPVVVKLNDYADAILKKREIKFTVKNPEIESTTSPMVVFQLHLSTIQLLHHFELQLGLRPVPIVTSSPIKYYPADVKFLSELILSRLERITKFYGIKDIPHAKPKDQKKIAPSNVFDQTLQFYMKLLHLSGAKEITPNQLYNQFFRAVQETRNIVVHQLPNVHDVKSRRILAASLQGIDPYGGSKLEIVKEKKSLNDVYKKSIKVRKMLIPLLKKQKLAYVKLPKKDKTDKPNAIDAFVQSQIIIAELSEWKDVIDVATSTPVTVQAHGKDYKDVYQELLEIEFILDKLQRIM